MAIKSNTYRLGVKDRRERYSNRVQLLVLTSEDDSTQVEPERYFVMEFDNGGNATGRDELPSISEARLEFNALVELIQDQEGTDSVYPI